MKSLLIFLSLITFAFPAYAAKTVSGSVPVVQPLQLPAAGINSNIKSNVQAQTPAALHQEQSDAAAAAAEQAQAAKTQNQTAVATPAAAKAGHSSWLWWLFGFFVLFLLVVFWLKMKADKV